MNKKAVLDITAELMKKMISIDEVEVITKRSVLRGREEGIRLMTEKKEQVDKLIQDVLASLDHREILAEITEEDTFDAFVLRYFRNVRYLVEAGADDIELPGMVPENDFSVWASVMLLDTAYL